MCVRSRRHHNLLGSVSELNQRYNCKPGMNSHLSKNMLMYIVVHFMQNIILQYAFVIITIIIIKLAIEANLSQLLQGYCNKHAQVTTIEVVAFCYAFDQPEFFNFVQQLADK